jgi:hypothetical protein
MAPLFSAYHAPTPVAHTPIYNRSHTRTHINGMIPLPRTSCSNKLILDWRTVARRALGARVHALNLFRCGWRRRRVRACVLHTQR